MSRLPVAVFVALVIATVGAFFVVQHLKVTTPLIQGSPAPVPDTINPVSGGVCQVRNGKGVLHPVSFRQMRISFYLQTRSDDVDVYMVDSDDRIVRQIGSDVYMRAGAHPRRHTFRWLGRAADGSVAPDGVYYIRVSLVHQGRELLIASPSGTDKPVTVDTARPRPAVTGVSPAALTAAGVSAAIVPDLPHQPAHRGRAAAGHDSLHRHRRCPAAHPHLSRRTQRPAAGQELLRHLTVRRQRLGRHHRWPSGAGGHVRGRRARDQQGVHDRCVAGHRRRRAARGDHGELRARRRPGRRP